MSRGQAIRVQPRRGLEFAITGNLVTETCYDCGILFAFPADWKAKRIENKDSWYCPNGHGQHYTQNEEDRLRAELERTQAEARRRENGLLDQLNTERANHEQTEKERRRIVKRIEAGVCTDCNRTFANLAEHMAVEHGGGAGHPSHPLTGLVVHKKRWVSGRSQRRDGTHVVRCGVQGIPLVRAAHFWKDVTCEDCRKAGGIAA